MGQTCTKGGAGQGTPSSRDRDDYGGGTTTLNTTHDEFRYLALGDSYTIGYGVSSKERWPIQLERKLLEVHRNKLRSIKTTIIARSGWTTHDLLNSIMNEKRSLLEVQTPYGLLSILIGSNNQYQGQSLGIYEKELQQLIQHALNLVANHDPRRIFVVSIPDYSHTPFGNKNKEQQKTISKEIDSYNKCCQQICQKYNIQFIDITKLTRNKKCSKLVLGDGLHPSGEQYYKWIDNFHRSIKPMIVKHDIP